MEHQQVHQSSRLPIHSDHDLQTNLKDQVILVVVLSRLRRFITVPITGWCFGHGFKESVESQVALSVTMGTRTTELTL